MSVEKKTLVTLHAALLTAYNMDEMRRLLGRLGVDIEDIGAQSDRPTTFWRIVQWFDTQGRLFELVAEARFGNPGNAELLNFWEKHLDSLLGQAVETDGAGMTMQPSDFAHLVQRLTIVEIKADNNSAALREIRDTLHDIEMHLRNGGAKKQEQTQWSSTDWWIVSILSLLFIGVGVVIILVWLNRQIITAPQGAAPLGYTLRLALVTALER